MCPDGVESVAVDVNPIVGGAFRFDMRTKEGAVLVHTGQYLEIERPDKLMFTWNSPVLGDHSSQVTVEFHEQAENCLVVLRHELPPDDALVEGHRQGWTSILDHFVQEQSTNKV